MNPLNPTELFIDSLFDIESQQTFQVIPKNGNPKVIHSTISKCLNRLSELNQNGAGIFITINKTDGQGRKAVNITEIRSLFLDLDGTPLEPVLEMMNASGIIPQMVVETSPEKYHVYIKVYDCPLDLFKPIQKALAQKFNGDKAVCDLPRVMRLPGFYHHKKKPFLTHIIEVNDIPAHSYTEVVEKLELDLEEQPKASSEPVNINQPLFDGQRTVALTKIIGHWIHQGFSNQYILSGLELWNHHNKPPLPHSKLVSTLTSIRSADDEKLDKNHPVLCELNCRYAVVQLGGKTLVLDIWKSTYLTFADFRNYLANRPPVNGQPAANYWLSHTRRRQYDGVDFLPGKAANDEVYNLWQGFSYEPAKGDCSLYLQHIEKNICDGDSIAYNYMLDWMAHCVQYPQKLPGTAIVLMGKQGTGKGVFVSEFGKLLGSHFKQVTSQQQILGRFNSVLSDSLLIFMDEAFWGGHKQMEGTLKTLITEPKRLIEFKGKDVIPMNNFSRVIMATNNDWAIPAGFEERRFFVLSVNEQRMQDTEYFKAITEQMENGGRSALMDFLMNHNISDVDIRNVPKTKALLSQKEETLGPVQDWWYQKLHDGQVEALSSCWPVEIDKKRLYSDFQEASNDRYTKTNSFYRQFKKLIPEYREERRQNEFGSRSRMIKLPTLERCRTHFEELLKQSVEWQD